MKRIPLKVWTRHLAFPLVVTLMMLLIAAVIGSIELALLSLMVGVAWGGLVVYGVYDRRTLYELRSIQKRAASVAEKSSRLVSKTESITSASRAGLDRIEEQLGALNRKAETESRVIRDIAGTVGSTAPVLRSIQAAIPGSGEVQSASGKNGSTAPVVAPPLPVVATPEKAASPTKFPEPEFIDKSPTYPNVRVGMIADEFTAKAFSYEWNTIDLTSEYWRQELSENQIDFLFVESAWDATNGSWRYHLVGPTAPRPAIVELINYCKEKKIPTVFWNKEDPPHFEHFLETAKLFDHIFTTESRLVQSYKNHLGHERVSVLPFAAQPRIHNPARIGKVRRDRDIVFGGMYFRDKYPERREQLDHLLPAASKFGFDIYSRHGGADEKYRFPERFTKFIRGSLSYPEMITAYHAYKTVINVNSVTDSATMCARRVFEATACGAAVVTETTDAIRNFFPGGLLTEVEGEDDAYNAMRQVIRSKEFRDRRVHLAQRHIWDNHTYRHRADSVMSSLGLESNVTEKNFSYFVTTNRPRNIETIFQNVGRQIAESKQLVLLTHGFQLKEDLASDLCQKYGISNFKLLYADMKSTLGENLNRLTRECDGSILFRMDDDDHYGEMYSKDLAHALHFSGAELVGKAASYVYFESSNDAVLTYESHESRFTDFLRGPTFCGPKDTFVRHQFPEVSISEDSKFLQQIIAGGGRIYSADRFNFMLIRTTDKGNHTWKATDRQLHASGDTKFIGRNPEQFTV